MHQRYEAHRYAIDEVVKLARQRNTAAESEADLLIERRSSHLVVLGGTIVLLVLVMAWFARRVAHQLSARVHFATGVAERVAQGDLTTEVPASNDADEAGTLLAAIGTR
jgi:nitrogen fixation/metabolism regulation signal transduction histidine kinase